MYGIFDIDNWREITATLARNKTRTFLTAFGIFWGTAMLAILSGGAAGLRGLMEYNFSGVGTNFAMLMPSPTSMSYQGYNRGTQWTLRDIDVDNIRRHVPFIEKSSAVDGTWASVAYSDKKVEAMIWGVESSYFEIQVPVLYAGRLLNPNDIARTAKVGVLGVNTAREIFGTEQEAIGKYVNANGIYVMIVGVIGSQGEISLGADMNTTLSIPLNTYRRAFNRGDAMRYLLMNIEPGHKLQEINDEICRQVRMNHPIHPDDDQAVRFFDGAEWFQMVQGLMIAISLLAAFVGMGTLIAGAIGVGNIMWIIVKERTKEIGIRRAIGAKPRDIIIQVLSEGMLMTAVAGMAGITFATIVLTIANRLIVLNPQMGPAGFEIKFYGALAIVAIFLVLGALAGIIPSIKAMRIKPIEAINDK